MKILTNEDICLLLEWKISKESAVPSWVMPNGKIVPTPPLTTSLDIQEKYIWPWLGKKGWAVSMDFSQEENCVVFSHYESPDQYRSDHKDAATAFNLALSELVNV